MRYFESIYDKEIFDGIEFDLYGSYTDLRKLNIKGNICFFSKNRGAVRFTHKCGGFIFPYKKDRIMCKGCKKVFNISSKTLIFLTKMYLFGK